MSSEHDQPNKKDTLDHAWRYFELHAAQRMAAFNFFITVSGLALAGIAGCIVVHGLRWIGVALGLMLMLAAFVFYRLDARTSFLVKLAEDALMALEAGVMAEGRVVTTERTKTAEAHVATYGWCFRTSFLAFALLGLAGAVYCWASASA